MPKKANKGVSTINTVSDVEEIRKSLLEMLKQNKMETAFAIDQVNNYCSLWELKAELEEDIRKKGVRIKVVNGNGFNTTKQNESIGTKLKVDSQMLKILTDLNLKQPISGGQINPKGSAYKK